MRSGSMSMTVLVMLCVVSLAACQAPVNLPLPMQTGVVQAAGAEPTAVPAAPAVDTIAAEAARAATRPSQQTIVIANTGGEGVVLRSEPRMDARTTVVYHDGAMLTMDGEDTGWAHVIAPQPGFIPPQYWKTAPAGSSAANVRYVSADGDGLFMRSKPEMEAKTKLWPDGTAIEVLADEGAWCKVRSPDGYVGYMPSRYLAAPPSPPVAVQIGPAAQQGAGKPAAVPTLNPSPTQKAAANNGVMPGVNMQCRRITNAEVCASVSHGTPTQNSLVTVFGKLTLDGRGQAGQAMRAVWQLKTGSTYCGATTDGGGLGACERNFGRVLTGHAIIVEINISGYSARTSFTPL